MSFRQRLKLPAVIGKGARKLAERRQPGVLEGEFGDGAGGDRPVDADAVPAYATVMVRRVEVRAFVADLAARLQCHEAVREADRYEQLVPVLRTELGPDLLAVARRAVAHVDRDVKIRPRTQRTSLPGARRGV